jgi:hypothetical protein
LLDVVLAAYRRAAIAWSAGGYTSRDESQRQVAAALIDLHGARYGEDLDRHGRTLIDDPDALWQLLRLLLEIATCAMASATSSNVSGLRVAPCSTD